MGPIVFDMGVYADWISLFVENFKQDWPCWSCAQATILIVTVELTIENHFEISVQANAN